MASRRREEKSRLLIYIENGMEAGRLAYESKNPKRQRELRNEERAWGYIASKTAETTKESLKQEHQTWINSLGKFGEPIKEIGNPLRRLEQAREARVDYAESEPHRNKVLALRRSEARGRRGGAKTFGRR